MLSDEEVKTGHDLFLRLQGRREWKTLYFIHALLADREELVEQNLKLRKENQVTLRMYHENKSVDNAIAKYMVQAEADKDELRTRIAELEAGVNKSLLSRALEALKAVEWIPKSGSPSLRFHACPVCDGLKIDINGHAPDCIVGNAIAEIEKFMEAVKDEKADD